jgi:hypothetical protein
MPFSKGIEKSLVIARETTFGTLASGPGTVLRRVQGGMQMGKDIYQSQEILPTQMVRDLRHGVRRVQGALSGQLSPGAYVDFFEGICRRAFTAGVNSTALTNVTAAAGPPGTFTRAAGSWITDGFKIGDVVRWSGWTTTGAANNARNYRIIALTALIMTVSGVGNEVVAAKASGDSVTATVVGKKTFVPHTGQQYYSYTIEQWFNDITASEQFKGCRVQGLNFSLPPTGMVGFDVQMVGQDMVTPIPNTRLYASPVGPTTDNSLAAVNGTLRFGSSDVATVVGASISLSTELEANPVVGSNIVPEIFQARVRCEGNLTVYVTDESLLQALLDETETSLSIYLTSDNSVNAPFISLTIPRLKISTASKNDSDRSITQQVNFVALENVAGGTGQATERTILVVQDSAA